MLSVILPNYNHAPYLKQRIDSILNQTYQDFELIILDDCSTDNSREIIEKYRNNSHVSSIVYNTKNSGSTFKQWKKGLELAKGEYIWIAESDDYSDITFLEKSLTSMKENNAVLSFTQSHVVDKENKNIFDKPPVITACHAQSQDFVKKYLLCYNSIYNASIVVFEKKLTNKINWKKITKLRYCGDWRFWTELLLNNKDNVSEVKEYLNYYRIHQANVSYNAGKKGLTFIEGIPISVDNAKLTGLKDYSGLFSYWINLYKAHNRMYAFDKGTKIKIGLTFMKYKPSLVKFLPKYLMKSLKFTRK